VYRLYGADGTLLYIGSAYDPDERWEHHRKKPWAVQVAQREERWYANRGAAYAAETAAIRSELPRYNVTNNPAAPRRERTGLNPIAHIFEHQVREIEGIKDDAEAALAASRALDENAFLSELLRAKRQECVRAIRSSGKTWAEIGTLLDMTPQRAQQIMTGVNGAQRRKASA
jgi:hypothetical protein